WNRRAWPGGVDRLRHRLDLCAPGRGRAEEFLALRQLEGAVLALAGLALGGFVFGAAAGGVLGVALLLGHPALAVRQAARQAALRLDRLRGRMPYAVGLMALMLESGAGFPPWLDTS